MTGSRYKYRFSLVKEGYKYRFSLVKEGYKYRFSLVKEGHKYRFSLVKEGHTFFTLEKYSHLPAERRFCFLRLRSSFCEIQGIIFLN